MKRGSVFVLAIASIAAVTHLTQANAAADARCSRPLVATVNALNAIDGRLDIGVTYEKYQELVVRANIAYKQAVATRDSEACVSQVRIPAGRALAAYIAAYKSWTKCRDWYLSPMVQNEIDWGGKVPTCEAGPGHGYKLRQSKWMAAATNVRRALHGLTL